MRAAAEQRAAWKAKGHGAYAELKGEADFLAKLPEHERVVCHLWSGDLVDCEMMHVHMRSLAAVHLETFFCQLRANEAPMMLEMVALSQLPTLLLSVSFGPVCLGSE